MWNLWIRWAQHEQDGSTHILVGETERLKGKNRKTWQRKKSSVSFFLLLLESFSLIRWPNKASVAPTRQRKEKLTFLFNLLACEDNSTDCRCVCGAICSALFLAVALACSVKTVTTPSELRQHYLCCLTYNASLMCTRARKSLRSHMGRTWMYQTLI